MTGAGRPAALFLVAALLVGACSSSAAAPSSSPSVEPSSPTSGGLPPGCTNLVLYDPDGDRIDLSGSWAGSGTLVGDTNEAAWLLQVGDCVFGTAVGTAGQFDDPTIGNLTGHIASDLTIGLALAIVRQPDQFAFAPYSTLEAVVEWDADGRIRIREVRDEGQRAERCVIETFDCPAPITWYRVDEVADGS